MTKERVRIDCAEFIKPRYRKYVESQDFSSCGFLDLDFWKIELLDIWVSGLLNIWIWTCGCLDISITGIVISVYLLLFLDTCGFLMFEFLALWFLGYLDFWICGWLDCWISIFAIPEHFDSGDSDRWTCGFQDVWFSNFCSWINVAGDWIMFSWVWSSIEAPSRRVYVYFLFVGKDVISPLEAFGHTTPKNFSGVQICL